MNKLGKTFILYVLTLSVNGFSQNISPKHPEALDFLFQQPLKIRSGLKEVCLSESIKEKGEALSDAHKKWCYHYSSEGYLLSKRKLDSNHVSEEWRYLYLKDKLYRIIKSRDNQHEIVQFDYNGTHKKISKFWSYTHSDKLVEIMAKSEQKPFEKYIITSELGEKSLITYKKDLLRNTRFRQRVLYHKGDTNQFYRVDFKDKNGSSYQVWKYKLDDGNIVKAENWKSKILADEYHYLYDTKGQLESIQRFSDQVLESQFDFFYGKHGLINSCLLSHRKHSQLSLVRFSYSFY